MHALKSDFFHKFKVIVNLVNFKVFVKREGNSIRLKWVDWLSLLCYLFQRNNMFINDNVLYASYMVGAKKVISTMTCAALPSDAPNPMNETSVRTTLLSKILCK